MFPSLRKHRTAEVVGRVVRTTTLKFKNIDYREVDRYISICSQPWQRHKWKVNKICPWRRYNKNKPPGITNKHVMGPHSGEEECWVFPCREATESEERWLLATALEIGILAAFTLHIFTITGKVYNQTDSCLIGENVAGDGSEVRMGDWCLRARELLVKNLIKIF